MKWDIGDIKVEIIKEKETHPEQYGEEFLAVYINGDYKGFIDNVGLISVPESPIPKRKI